MDTLYAILDWPGTKWLLLVFTFVMPVASLLTWAERRQSAMMQDRLGPNRANIKLPLIGDLRLWGILHFIADAIKMIGKEDFVPAKAHKPLFSLAPILALAPVLIAVIIIPFGPTIYPDMFWDVIPATDLHMWQMGAAAQPDWAKTSITLQIFQIDYGLIFYFAILTVANYGATIAGWASYNKWALLGGLRASSQMMSYEVAMGLSLMSVFLFMGTLEPGAMVAWQGPNPLNWGVLTPLPFAAFILFFTAAIAETKRGPFDLPEGEPEIIGYFVEYSGIRWGMFFLAEFIEIVFISMVVTTVFFGGYHFPFLYENGFQWLGYNLYLPHVVVVLIQLLTFGLKVVFFCWLQLAIRWTLPRFRVDQLMTLGWKRLLPLALANLMIAALLSLWL
jgi:NADH-quinone oxidoreductase subunit H